MHTDDATNLQPKSTERPTRRDFFQRSALAAAPAALAASAFAATARAATTTGTPIIPELYPGTNKKQFAEIRANEDTHWRFIVDILGANARPKPTFQNLSVPNNSPAYLAAMGATFCNTGGAAYLGALPYVYDPSIREAAASIALVEVSQAGYLNALVNFPIVPNGSPFVAPFTIPQVLQNAAPFIADQNVIAAMTFSTTPSPQNDIAILNFALVLEYLEMTFYDMNILPIIGV